MNATLPASSRALRRFGAWSIATRDRHEPVFNRVRVGALLLGCAFLFWQRDASLSDMLFGVGIAVSILLLGRRRRMFDVAWPQLLALVVLTVTGLATVIAGADVPAFLITAYLIALCLAMVPVLEGRPDRLRIVETGLVFSGSVAAVLICIGYAARQFGWAALDILAYDAFRGQGLFKDPNAAGAFTACAYPFAAASAIRARRFQTILLLGWTAIFGAGVVFSFSREALILFAIAVVGVIAVLGMLHKTRSMVVLLALCVVAGASAGALNRLPNYRGYQLLNAYDQNGRLVVWRFAIDMLRSAPLGTGAGSFERRSQEEFDEALGKGKLPNRIDATGITPVPVDGAAGFHSVNVASPASLNLGPDVISEPITLAFRNTGTRTWTRGAAGEEARLGVGEAGLVLEGGPTGLIARFRNVTDDTASSLAVGWPASDRVAAQNEETVAPGAEGTFTFHLRAPRQAGTYRLHLRPVIDGVTWMEDDGVALEVTVSSTASDSTVFTTAPAVTPPAGGDLIPPLPPSAYAVPDGAMRVSTSSELISALAVPAARDIVLMDGVYDNTAPFYNPYGDNLYAATLGRAVLRAGVSMGSNDGPGGGSLQGITFDVSDPAKTLNNSVVNIWGGAVGSRILDVAINGHKAIQSGILTMPLDGVVMQRVAVHDVTLFGVAVLSGELPASPVLLEDIEVTSVVRTAANAANGTGESCLWLGNSTMVHRALLRSCGLAGVWAGANNTSSQLEHIDISDAPYGVYVDENASGISVLHLHVGPFVSNGILAAGLAARQPAPSSSSDLVVVPSAHNTYLRVAAESGALGFVALIAYLILTFWSLLNRGWREHWPLQLGVGLILLAGLAVDTLHWRQLWLYLAMAGAVGTRGPAPIDTAQLMGPTSRAAEKIGGSVLKNSRKLRPLANDIQVRVVGLLRAARSFADASGHVLARIAPRPTPRVPILTPALRMPSAKPTLNASREPVSEELRAAFDHLVRMEARLGHDDPRVAAQRHLIGAMHHEAGRLDDAIKYYLEALDARERALGPDDPEVASTLDDLADAQRERGDGAQAALLLTRAAAIRQARRSR